MSPAALEEGVREFYRLMADEGAKHGEGAPRERRNGRPPALNLNFFCHQSPSPQPETELRWLEELGPEYRRLGVAELPAVGSVGGRRPFDQDSLELLKRLKPRVASFHFGLPAAEALAELKVRGFVVLASATTVEEGVWLAEHGADAVIAQGLEAGGHRGHFLSGDLGLQAGLEPLLAGLVRALGPLPVVAAGGVASEADVRRALALGASGVQVGSAFLRSPETETSALHREALDRLAGLGERQAGETALTNVFTGRPARGILNHAMREFGPLSPLVPSFPLGTVASGPLRKAAEARGSSDWTPMWSGTNLRNYAGEHPGAQEIAEELAKGFELHD